MGLSLLQGTVLDMVAEGKSPRQIAEVLGIEPHEAARMAYELLDAEIVTDIEQRRKLQVYRLEKLIEALWQRTMNSANKDDVKNVVDILDKLNVLLGLNKEADAEEARRMHAHQFAAYISVLQQLLTNFMSLAPDLKTPEEWQVWTAEQVDTAKKQMMREIEQ